MPDSPGLLTDDQVRAALRDLPDWSGDQHHVLRTVALAADRVDVVLDQVHRIEDELDHHTQIESRPTDDAETVLTFKIWTHSAGGVTERDLQLAQRLDAVLGAG